jgi:hypothetical protein
MAAWWQRSSRLFLRNKLLSRGNIMERNRLSCKFFLGSLAFVVAAILGGCGGPTDKQPDGKPAASAASNESEKGAAAEAAQPDDRPGLAELSTADRALAEKQKLCPVTGEALGSMGKPVKITVKGQTVFLCCAGCEGKIRKDPDTYLAKMKKTAAN